MKCREMRGPQAGNSGWSMLLGVFPPAAPTGLRSFRGSTSSPECDLAYEVSHADNKGVAFSSSLGISGIGRTQKRHPDGVLAISFNARLRIEVFIGIFKRDFDVRAIEK